MLFCPNCGNIVLLDNSGVVRYYCMTCPYTYDVKQNHEYQLEKQEFTQKNIITTKQMADGQKVKEECPKCQHDTAYCIMFQTRSSDEPMTRFFMCEKCKHRWKNDQ